MKVVILLYSGALDHWEKTFINMKNGAMSLWTKCIFYKTQSPQECQTYASIVSLVHLTHVSVTDAFPLEISKSLKYQ